MIFESITATDGIIFIAVIFESITATDGIIFIAVIMVVEVLVISAFVVVQDPPPTQTTRSGTAVGAGRAG